MTEAEKPTGGTREAAAQGPTEGESGAGTHGPATGIQKAGVGGPAMAGTSNTIQTARLLLRPWRTADHAPLAALNADPRVTEFLGGPLTRAQSDDLARRLERERANRGWGLWALEEMASGGFLGFCGLHLVDFRPPFDVHATTQVEGPVEVGWRLAPAAWGHGFATEAASAALAVAFRDLRLPEVVSFTAERNERSRAVMHRLGLRQDVAATFDHPKLPSGHPLRRHVLYRISADTWHHIHTRP